MQGKFTTRSTMSNVQESRQDHAGCACSLSGLDELQEHAWQWHVRCHHCDLQDQLHPPGDEQEQGKNACDLQVKTLYFLEDDEKAELLASLLRLAV